MRRIVTSLIAMIALVAGSASAKNLDSRFGFGVTSTGFNDLAAMSLRYHFDPFLSTAFSVGFNTDDSKNSIRVGAKIARNVSMEENVNFYLGAGLFMIADKSNSSTLSAGLELDGIIGVEFFLSGLPSLGISVETGLALRSVRSVAFHSFGTAFGGAGIHYYF